MLKDIQKAINKVFADYDVTLQTNNEAMDERDTMAMVMAVEVLKEVTSQPSTPKPKKAKEKKEHEPTPQPLPVNLIGSVSS